MLDQTARVANEVGGGAAPGLPSDPRQRADVARDFESDIGAEQGGDLAGVRPRADAGEKLPRDAGVLLLTDGRSPRE